MWKSPLTLSTERLFQAWRDGENLRKDIPKNCARVLTKIMTAFVYNIQYCLNFCQHIINDNVDLGANANTWNKWRDVYGCKQFVNMTAQIAKLNVREWIWIQELPYHDVLKPYRANLNDKLPKLVLFSWFRTINKQFWLITIQNWKLEKSIWTADSRQSAKIV